jgi:hypothetical protein
MDRAGLSKTDAHIKAPQENPRQLLAPTVLLQVISNTFSRLAKA